MFDDSKKLGRGPGSGIGAKLKIKPSVLSTIKKPDWRGDKWKRQDDVGAAAHSLMDGL